jgi:hypothetical protein
VVPRDRRARGIAHGIQAGDRPRDEHRLIQDPLNPNVALDPYGANSVVYAAGLHRARLVAARSEARPGEIRDVEIQTPSFGGKRRIQVYLPARFVRRGVIRCSSCTTARIMCATRA